MSKDKVGEREPCPDEGAREDGESEVVVESDVKGLDDGAAETDDNGSEGLTEDAEVEDLPQVAAAVPEADRDEGAGDGRGQEACERLARRKRQELEAGEVGRQRGRVASPQTADG